MGPQDVKRNFKEFKKMIRNVDMFLEFKETIPAPPQAPQAMYQQASSNDEVTINHWREKWIANAKETKKRFGSFKEHGIGKLFNSNRTRPCIVVGSGPSLKNNIETLSKVKGIPIISCLHNFHYMVDNNVPVDYFVTLDAGEVVVEEIFEGGKHPPEYYFEKTKDYKLLAYIGSHKSLWNTWKGEVKLFTSPLADEAYRKALDEIEPFYTYVSTGGNVLGAATYIARAIMGSATIIFCGADFSFSYTRQFHAWDSKYDKDIGQCLRAIDVFGNSVLTWQSYFNFKTWFDWLCTNIHGIWINCTEGGLLGSYPEGNIAQVKQMRLEDCLRMYDVHEEISAQCETPDIKQDKILF
jgi:hypothetical protein